MVNPQSSPGGPGTLYVERREQFSKRAAQSESRSSRYTQLRTLVFLGILLGIAAGWLIPDIRAPAWIIAGLLLIGFVRIVQKHGAIQAELGRLKALERLNEHALAKLERRWDVLPTIGVALPERVRATAQDLDLFGRASLFQLLCSANTPGGIARLRDWLIDPAEPDEIVQRQRAVAELAPQLELRQELNVRGRSLRSATADPHSLLEWSEGQPWYTGRRWLHWTARALTALALIVLVLAFADLVPDSLLLGALVVNLAFGSIWTGQTHDLFSKISSRDREIHIYCDLFELGHQLQGDSSRIEQLRRQLIDPEHGGHAQLDQLARIMNLANFRFSPLVHSIVQALFLWDLHVMARLDRWQQREGHRARAWFEALAQLEALSSLANLAHDQPDWCFPEVSRTDERQQRTLEAQKLGHPLLRNDVRVANDVAVGPPGSFLLVTGSNMSGKSTLLRSIGVNAVLAQAGAPVCALQLRMPPTTVTTSMRIQDSLAGGVSFFMAELKRLKEIVDQAHAYAGQQRILLYLLDEILQGTNSRERHIAVTRVIGHLVAQGAIGAVSTHDLELAQTPPLDTACRPVHFRETIHSDDEHGRMTFDYRMHHGVATTTNALKLLEIVGLGEE